MNITKNDTVKINCQPELGEGIVRDIFQIDGGPTNVVVSFGEQGKIEYFFPCELTKVDAYTTEMPDKYSTYKDLMVEGCPKCGNKTCRCKENTKLDLNSLKEDIDILFALRLKELLEIPAQNLRPEQTSLLITMYKLTE